MFFTGGLFAIGRDSPAESQQIPSVIKAKAFQVIGNNGQVLVTMSADPNGHGFVGTFNAEGKVLAEMGAKGHL